MLWTSKTLKQVVNRNCFIVIILHAFESELIIIVLSKWFMDNYILN